MSAAIWIVRVTLRQTLGTRQILLFGAFAAVPTVIFLAGSARESGLSLLSTYLNVGTFHFLVAAPITALILSTAMLGAERRDKTLSFIVVRPLSRAAIIAAKLIAALLAALAFNLAGVSVLSLLYGLESGNWSEWVPMLVGSGVATAVYTAVFVPLGYFTERATLIGLAYIFIWEDGIIAAIGTLGIMSPSRIGYSAFVGLASPQVARLIDDVALVDLSPGVGVALLRMAVFVAFALGLMTWVFRTRDLV